MSHRPGSRMAQQSKFIIGHRTWWLENLLKSSQYHVLKRPISVKEVWKATNFQMTFYNALQEILGLKGGGTRQVTNQKTAQHIKCSRKTSWQTECQIRHHGNCHKMWMMREMLICLTSLVSLSWKTSFIVNHSFLTGHQHFVPRIAKTHLKWPRSQI